MIKYVVYDNDDIDYVLLKNKNETNFNFTTGLDEQHDGIIFNFTTMDNINNEVYSFYNKIKEKEIKNIEIYLISDEKVKKIFDLNIYNNFKISKILYDNRLSPVERTPGEKISFLLEDK